VLEKVALEGEDENIIEDAEVEEAAADSSDADPDDDDQNTTELLRPMGRLAGGVRCFNLLGDDYVVSLIVPKIELGGRLLFATESGYGSIIQIARFPRRNSRNSQGVRSMKLDDRNGNRLVGALQVTLEDEVMLITDQGNIIRTFVDQIRETGRLSKGVRIIRLANDAKLITLERIAREALDDKDEVISSEDAAETEAGTVTDDASEQEPQNSDQ
jgi:DNA gyrase subunit A